MNMKLSEQKPLLYSFVLCLKNSFAELRHSKVKGEKNQRSAEDAHASFAHDELRKFRFKK